MDVPVADVVVAGNRAADAVLRFQDQNAPAGSVSIRWTSTSADGVPVAVFAASNASRTFSDPARTSSSDALPGLAMGRMAPINWPGGGPDVAMRSPPASLA